MAGLNWFDIVIIIVLLVGMGVGYVQGIVRQLIGLLVMYVALILATQFFRPVSHGIAGVLFVEPNTFTNMVSFFAIFFVALLVINFLAQDAYKSTRIRMIPIVDHLGGMFLGLVSVWVILSVSVSVLGFAVSTQGWLQAEGFRQTVETGLLDSRLAALTESTLPIIIVTVSPWLPTGLPALFKF